MKWNYIATAAAALLLVGTGIYWFNNSSSAPKLNPTSETKVKRVEIIDGEEVVLETPLTQSFSNAQSNRYSQNPQNTPENNIVNTTKVTHTVMDTVTKPFFVGIYYVNNLRKKGFDMCKLKNIESQGEVEKQERSLFLDLDGEPEITKIEKGNDQIFVYVDADETPESMCARFIQSPLFDYLNIDPVHFIVQ